MTPYTRDAVLQIRSAIKGGTPADLVRQSLGWDASMFDNICRRHGIERNAPVLEIDFPTPPSPVKAKPGPLPKAAEKRGLVSCAVALKPDILAKIEKYAERAGVSRHRAAGSIVAEYIATVGASQITFLARSDYGASRDAEVISIGLEEETWMVLYEESQRRKMKVATVGVLVKACLIRYFDSP